MPASGLRHVEELKSRGLLGRALAERLGVTEKSVRKLLQRAGLTQNASVEGFNGKHRDTCLNLHCFLDLEDARQTIEAWRTDCAEVRPHRSLGSRPPATDARLLSGTPPTVETEETSARCSPQRISTRTSSPGLAREEGPPSLSDSATRAPSLQKATIEGPHRVPDHAITGVFAPWDFDLVPLGGLSVGSHSSSSRACRGDRVRFPARFPSAAVSVDRDLDIRALFDEMKQASRGDVFEVKTDDAQVGVVID